MNNKTISLSHRRELWLLITIAGIQFTHILDFMIMMPLGPQFTRLFGISDAQFGLLVSAYTLSAGASGLAAATYVDRFDRKRLLITLYGLFALATLACGLAPGYGFLMVARVAAGMFGGVLSALSQTIVADVVPFERRGRAMGIVMSSFSVSTVAGVPLGLFLASHWSWQAPFIGIALLSGVLALGAALTLPRLNHHLLVKDRPSIWRGIGMVLAEPNHQRAFAFSALLMFTGFTVLPYLTIYLQTNVGVQETQIPYLYLCGGVATLFTARLFGRLADRLGKVRTFTMLALAVIVPMLATTLMPLWPLWGVLIVSTALFICMSGRMIPGMALVTGAANPALRGTFMALNASVQSAAMGLASFLGGLIISRDTAGLVQHYWVSGLLGACASLAAIFMARRLRVHGAGVGQAAAP
ncbi:MAG: MFS transporter [Burkholderiales bacterium RIFCSPLOWO2_12_67_14]|nr:MAG: MFS transporter [Burkholderiales bacterium RIFCSPLOWO2_02_FULL_67_64]OGB38932.1 MAG: MFS transporter [Burkholderiales bacterium RIFCSPHIGHO2_12_FULL_67_38]OGB42099.1 MAG: MFS transporter [Burkholderiales bacterium RIFCSPLOWO2_12_67_14]